MAKYAGGTRKATYETPKTTVEDLARYSKKNIRKIRSIRDLKSGLEATDYVVNNGYATKALGREVKKNINDRIAELRKQRAGRKWGR